MNQDIDFPIDRKEKWRQTMLKRFNGDELKLTEHLSTIGRRGGQIKGVKGFAADHDLARRAGSIGGTTTAKRRRSGKRTEKA